ncbi:MAG: D-sedoheptulose 7-phosphate isomerase [Candidatus Cyclobacteriaceae bacterium M3_2C_046]
MSYRALIKEQLTEAVHTLDAFLKEEQNIQKIQDAAALLAGSIDQGGKIICCGNGGSHCDAMHFAEELTGQYRDRRKALPALAISDSSHITCVANDYGFDSIFSRYVQALGRSGDVLFCLSTSGNSPNIVAAAQVARQQNMKVVALTGKTGGSLAQIADLEIRVPHQGYSDRIQEIHIKIIHILILLIEKQIC